MSNLSELLPTGGGQNAVDFVAFENITAGQAVALRSDGQIEVADSGNFANVIGLAAEAITSGNTGAVNVFGGINEAQSGLTIGSDYYIDSSGNLTTSSSGSNIKLGQAITATTINLLDYPSILTVVGQQAYTAAGTYSWVAPASVTSISVVAVGGGGSGAAGVGDPTQSYYGPPGIGGGGGGSLRWQNEIPVTSGDTYTVVVGAGGAGVYNGSTIAGNSGGQSYFGAASGSNFCQAPGGGGGQLGAATAQTASGASNGSGTGGGGQGGGSNYNAGAFSGAGRNGAGGAGGYQAGSATASFGEAMSANQDGSAGEYGGGGGGVGRGNRTYMSGGGVGILGEGSSGAGGTAATSTGRGGSSGADGIQTNNNGGTGGAYGGGGGGTLSVPNGAVASGAGGVGAVRIIWGTDRAFPSTNTGDL